MEDTYAHFLLSIACSDWSCGIINSMEGRRRNSHKEVTHLLGLQCQLNEDLLQLFVDKVDAKLLKAVPLKDRSNMLKMTTLNLECFYRRCVLCVCVCVP